MSVVAVTGWGMEQKAPPSGCVLCCPYLECSFSWLVFCYRFFNFPFLFCVKQGVEVTPGVGDKPAGVSCLFLVGSSRPRSNQNLYGKPGVHSTDFLRKGML